MENKLNMDMERLFRLLKQSTATVVHDASVSSGYNRAPASPFTGVIGDALQPANHQRVTTLKPTMNSVSRARPKQTVDGVDIDALPMIDALSPTTMTPLTVVQRAASTASSMNSESAQSTQL